MVYYELYGLPGAGKTTLTSIIIKNLKNLGYKVASYHDIYGVGKLNKLYWLKILSHPAEYRLFFYYLQLYNKCRYKERGFLKKLIYYSHRVLVESKTDNFDVILLDEGIIQFISSLYYLENIPDDNNLDKIVRYLRSRIDLKTIYCSVDISTSLQRIKDRPYKQTGRFSHSIGTSVLENALKYRSYNLNLISSLFPSQIEINMAKPVEENANFLLSLIDCYCKRS